MDLEVICTLEFGRKKLWVRRMDRLPREHHRGERVRNFHRRADAGPPVSTSGSSLCFFMLFTAFYHFLLLLGGGSGQTGSNGGSRGQICLCQLTKCAKNASKCASGALGPILAHLALPTMPKLDQVCQYTAKCARSMPGCQKLTDSARNGVKTDM